MKIGLIDVDSHNYPNLCLMKISAWHKAQGDSVEWYDPLFSGHLDRVYMSKVFTFSQDYPYYVNATEVVRCGTGYFYPDGGDSLPDEIEHMMPDYSIYGIEDTAYGRLTTGCPRGCNFCIVQHKEGRKSVKHADLSEFWNGQKYIVLLDPNILACRDWKDLLQQLIDSKAQVDFNQGLDIRMMTPEKAEMLSRIRTKRLHFAWDRYEDKAIIQPKFEEFRKVCKTHPHDLEVYVLCGDVERRVRDEDLERIYWLRDNGYAPYVMLFDKDKLPRGHELLKLQRWVNNRFVFWKVKKFEEYKRSKK